MVSFYGFIASLAPGFARSAQMVILKPET